MHGCREEKHICGLSFCSIKTIRLLPSLRAEGEGPGERPAPVLRVGEAEADDAAGVQFNGHLEFLMQIWNRLWDKFWVNFSSAGTSQKPFPGSVNMM